MALALCNRLLATDPQNKEAAALLDGLSASRTWLKVGLIAGLALLLAAGAFVLVTHFASPGKETAAKRTRAARLVGEPLVAEGFDGGLFFDAGALSDDGGASGAEGVDAETTDREALAEKQAARARKRRRRRHRAPPSSRRQPPRPRSHVADGSVTPASAAGDQKPDAGIPSARPSRPIDRRPGRLVLAIRPWCNATVDGRKVGRSPSGKAIELEPGRHRVVCRQGPGRPAFRKTIELAAGQKLTLRGTVLRSSRIRIRLSSAKRAVNIDGSTYRSGTKRLPSGRHRVVLLEDGVPQKTRWLTFPPGSGCTLVDTPRLDCR
jgi:hypothetical protein